MNRNICLLFFFLLFACIASAQERKASNFILKGSFVGKHAHAIFLSYKDDNGKGIEYKAYIRRGFFSFRGFIGSPVYAFLRSDIKITPNSPDVSNAVEVFLSPGNMAVSLNENDFANAVLKGSLMQDEFKEVEILEKPINNIRVSLFHKLFAIERLGNTPKNHITHIAVAAEINKYDLVINQVDYQYIISHPKSYISAYLLNNFVAMDMRLDSIETAFNKLSSPVKKSLDGKAINKAIVNRKASIVGSVVRMPFGTNLDGSRFKPKSLIINNYLLIYFWADWANDNANLKAVYNNYQSRGLKILAVSTVPFKKMWRDTIKRERIGMWYNIFSDPTANLDTFYNIRQTPPSLVLLVDKNHTIIGRYRGSGKFYKMGYDEQPLSELDKKLSKIIK